MAECAGPTPGRPLEPAAVTGEVKNALLKVGNKNDRIDSRKLAELLHSNLLRSVLCENTGLRTMKELARGYMTITKDLTRVMVRLKAIYRSWAIPFASQQFYELRHRAAWLEKITEAGVRRRAVPGLLRCARCQKAETTDGASYAVTGNLRALMNPTAQLTKS